MISAHLPTYGSDETKVALLAAGVSGTVYALVMPESEAVFADVIDGRGMGREAGLFDAYREAWTQKQDAAHQSYFERWIEWSSPVVELDPARFRFRYPTAGASEGIFKLMAEYAARARNEGFEPSVHIFEGEYEGFVAYATALALPLVRHRRGQWAQAAEQIDRHGQVWMSQPSAIDGMVWPHFEAFARLLAERRPEAELIPDLTYVGNVARPFSVALDTPNVSALVVSQSKPFGGYYHRAGGVLSSRERPSLVGNTWFKNLASLAWAETMMARFDVHELPARYHAVQVEAARRAGELLGLDRLVACDVNVLAIAPARDDQSEVLKAVHRGGDSERVVRLCLTPGMATLIDRRLGGVLAPGLLKRWAEAGWA